MVPSNQGRLLQTARVVAKQSVVKPLSLSSALAMIKKGCDPTFLAAVGASGGQFLYRGEDLPVERPAALLSPPPDLLQLDTYGSKDALRYFERLETELSASGIAARPSSAHIAVARPEAAALWGTAVSVWPLGQPLHYVWPRARDDFWPERGLSDAEARGGLGRCQVDEGLSEALRLGREVLFASESGAAFVAIPASADDEVRRQLALG